MKISSLIQMKNIFKFFMLGFVLIFICFGCERSPPATTTPCPTPPPPPAKVKIGGKWYYVLNIQLQDNAEMQKINIDLVKQAFEAAVGPGITNITLVSTVRPEDSLPNYHYVDECIMKAASLTSSESVGSHARQGKNHSSVDIKSIEIECGKYIGNVSSMTFSVVTVHEICHYWQKDHENVVGNIMHDNVTLNMARIQTAVKASSLRMPLLISEPLAEKIKTSLLVDPQPCSICGHTAHFKPFSKTPVACTTPGCNCKPCPKCGHASHFTTGEMITDCTEPKCNCKHCPGCYHFFHDSLCWVCTCEYRGNIIPPK